MNARFRARADTVLDRLSVVSRWRITSVVLATIVLVMPLASGTGDFYRGLSVPEVMLVTFVGMAAGWVALDRLVAYRAAIASTAIVALWIAAGIAHAALVVGQREPGVWVLVLATLVVSVAMGALIRGTTDGRRSIAALVTIATTTSWVTYDLGRLPIQPLRDFDLYLQAGATALRGASPYITAPVLPGTSLTHLPFVYPPFTIPLFEILASMARPVAVGLWEAGSIAAVVAGLWMLGVRGRWLLVLLAWPAFSVGIAVGNVASFTFLLFVVGFRVGAALVLSGAFKIQSTIPSLWLVLERRWRELAAGVALVAVLALISLPIVGVRTWLDWPAGLREFQDSFVAYPSLQGLSLVRWHGQAVALAVTVFALGFAFLRRGRNSLARFGLASIVGSPTLYIHGLSPLLAGAFSLGPELLWFFLAFGPWPFPFGLRSAWVAMAIAGLALHISRGDDLDTPGDLTPSRADVHPVARSRQVWPSAGSPLPHLPDPSRDIDMT